LKVNRLEISEEQILKNIRAVQKKNELLVSDELDGMDFSVEMETGTGKTYVYLRTIYELNKKYGFKKFVISCALYCHPFEKDKGWRQLYWPLKHDKVTDDMLIKASLSNIPLISVSNSVISTGNPPAIAQCSLFWTMEKNSLVIDVSLS